MIEISYVLPTYNRAEYLGECILSLLEQNYNQDKIEIIVVDDGSTDTTPELMAFFKTNYKNIYYFPIQHQGVEEARNYGNAVAHAPIIGVCDSDDLYHPDRTKITLDYFKKHPEVDIMNGSYVEIFHNGLPIGEYRAKAINKKRFFSGKQEYFCHDNCAYKKEKILQTPYRKEGGETDDWKLVHDWLKAGYKFGYIAKELCKVRRLKNGIMAPRRFKRGQKIRYE